MSGHAFVRPGQVAPDLPPPDNCVTCGLSEASHAVEPAEVVAARAMLTDFQNQVHEFSTGTQPDVDFLTWALRLSQHLQQVIDR